MKNTRPRAGNGRATDTFAGARGRGFESLYYPNITVGYLINGNASGIFVNVRDGGLLAEVGGSRAECERCEASAVGIIRIRTSLRNPPTPIGRFEREWGAERRRGL